MISEHICHEPLARYARPTLVCPRRFAVEWQVELPFYHRDPFDRLIIAQSLAEGIPVVSSDAAFDAYGVGRIW